MFTKKIPLILEIHKETPLTEFLSFFEKCPKNTELYVLAEENWQYLHSISAVKQIKEAARHIKLFFCTKDSIAKKHLESVEIDIIDTPPEDAKDFYEELMPESKFYHSKMGEAFETKELEVVKVIKQTGEEHISRMYNEIEGLSLKQKILLSFAGIASIALLSFLVAIILPSATITVQAEKKMLEGIMNINFIKSENEFTTPLDDTGNNFYLYPIEFRFEDSIEFPVISKIFEGQNAFGDVTLYNNFDEDITLRDGTRLQTEDGLIFLSKHYVRIPARRTITNENGQNEVVPGEALVNVIANETDLYQEVMGSRGNIAPKNFIVPGLTNYMQNFIWGESKNTFRGGTTKWRMEVQQSDLDAASEKMRNILFTKAKEEMQKYIQEQNIFLGKNVAFFPLDDYITQEVSKITFPEDILGQSVKNFQVDGEMLVSAFVYYENGFRSFIEDHMQKKHDPNMKVEEIEYNTMTFRKFNETESEIRVTIDVKARQSYDINEFSDSGKEFQEKIKMEIRGMTRNDAMRFLSNKEEISTVDVAIWPPVKQRLPFIKKNITIVEK